MLGKLVELFDEEEAPPRCGAAAATGEVGATRRAANPWWVMLLHPRYLLQSI
jgi:hypothetical protein